MKAQKTIKVSDDVHAMATRLADAAGLSKSKLIDLVLKAAEKEGSLKLSFKEDKQSPPLDLARGSQSGDVRGAGRKTKGAKAK